MLGYFCLSLLIFLRLHICSMSIQPVTIKFNPQVGSHHRKTSWDYVFYFKFMVIIPECSALKYVGESFRFMYVLCAWNWLSCMVLCFRWPKVNFARFRKWFFQFFSMIQISVFVVAINTFSCCIIFSSLLCAESVWSFMLLPRSWRKSSCT